MDEQLSLYKSIVTVNLAELLGKEKALSDAYLQHVLNYNSPHITYVTFDFHEHCRGMKFENVSALTDNINNIIKKMRYCWVDPKGMICEQRGVFRVNCVDCLDRTNVVQSAVARIVMETQCRKLGMLAPDEVLPQSCKTTFQQLWANNGDAISRQYAGTAALKGDYTRTGERKFTGVMKDGMNSANRYYLRFKDSYRQAAIDLTLGRPLVFEESLLLGNSNLEEDSAELMEKEQNLKLLVEDCKEMLVVEPEQCLGGWSLINADPTTGEPDRTDMDVILLLSQRAVYIAWYDDEEESFVQYQRIFLEDIESIEIGPEPALFKSKFVCMRLHYRHYAEEGFFHTFRTPNTRLFNNMVIAVHNQEEAKESLKAIHQAFSAARQIMKMDLQIDEKMKLERKKTRSHPDVLDIHRQQQENALTGIHIPRDISSPDLQRYSKSGGTSPEPQRMVYRSTSPALKRSPASSPILRRKNILSNFSADMRKTLNTGIKLNFSVPKFSLQNVKLPKRFGGNVRAVDAESLESRKKNLKDMRDHQRERKISQDDSSVGTTSGSFDESILDNDENIVLDSCGIIATKSQTGLSDSPKCLPQMEEAAQMLESVEPDLIDFSNNKSKDQDRSTNSTTQDQSDDDDAFLVIEETDVNKFVESKKEKSQLRENLCITVPKIVTSAAKSRKLQRIKENLEGQIAEMVGDKDCFTKIIIV